MMSSRVNNSSKSAFNTPKVWSKAVFIPTHHHQVVIIQGWCKYLVCKYVQKEKNKKNNCVGQYSIMSILVSAKTEPELDIAYRNMKVMVIVQEPGFVFHK